MSKLAQVVAKKIGQAIYRYKMIKAGDRILVAVSGGKDSLILLHDLVRRRPCFPLPYELTALHIQTDFCTCCQKSDLEATLKEWEVPYTIKEVGVIRRLKPGRKMNCYWCATQRRTELLKFARQHGFNKIALGHHQDDIIETLLMNICFKGEIAAMLPHMSYQKYPLSIIRPLALVTERLIVRLAAELDFQPLTCQCPYSTQSKRLAVRCAIAELARADKALRLNIFKAMSNINRAYLPEPE